MFQWDTECKQNTERNQVQLFGQVIIDGCQLITSSNESVNKQFYSHFKFSSSGTEGHQLVYLLIMRPPSLAYVTKNHIFSCMLTLCGG